MHILNPELVSGQIKVDSWVTVTSILASTVSFGFMEREGNKRCSDDLGMRGCMHTGPVHIQMNSTSESWGTLLLTVVPGDKNGAEKLRVDVIAVLISWHCELFTFGMLLV